MQEGSALGRVVDLVRDLRKRCPWDAAQTPATLRPYLVEEALELDQAIGSDDMVEGATAFLEKRRPSFRAWPSSAATSASTANGIGLSGSPLSSCASGGNRAARSDGVGVAHDSERIVITTSVTRNIASCAPR